MSTGSSPTTSPRAPSPSAVPGAVPQVEVPSNVGAPPSPTVRLRHLHPPRSPREDVSLGSELSLPITETLFDAKANPWTLRFDTDPELETAFRDHYFAENRSKQRAMLFLTPFICLITEVLLYWAFDLYRNDEFFVIMGVNQLVVTACAIFTTTTMFTRRSAPYVSTLSIFTMCTSIITWEMLNHSDLWAFTIMMMVILLLQGLVCPLYKISFRNMIIIHAILWLYFTIFTFAEKNYHTPARGAFFSITYLTTALFFAYSAYVTEHFIRKNFVSQRELTARNRSLRNHLVQITKLKKSNLDLESPMEKAVEIVRRWIADSTISTAMPEVELQTLMTILSNQDFWAPDLQDQLNRSSVDKEIKDWVMYEWPNNKGGPSRGPRKSATGGRKSSASQPIRVTYSALPVLLPDEEDSLSTMLAETPKWNFGIFDVDRMTHERPLYFVCYSLMRRYDLLETFNIPDETLKNFLTAVEHGYRDNPFHNRVHSADVVMNMDYLMSHPRLEPHLTPMDRLAGLLAACCHDYDHTGLNNAFQINTLSKQAVLYNDKSVLENHHVAASFKLLLETENCNILEGLSSDEKKEFRSTMIETILATDMALHFEIMGHFNTKLQSGEFSLEEKRDKLMALKLCLKCADIGHTTKEFDLHMNWTKRIQDEFFLQGDRERDLGLEVSPFMDREKPSMAKSQLGFLDFVCKPLFQSWESFLQDDIGLVRQLEANYDEWKSRAASGAGGE